MKKLNAKVAQEIENTSMNRLIFKYSIPAILSGLVSAIYNIVDQIFIGNIEGMIGNSATNVAFPLVTICTALALLFGIGGTANFSISLGKGDVERAKKFAGTVIVFVPIAGVLLAIFTGIFTEPLLKLFGATDENFELALAYTKIVSLGYPFAMCLSGVTQIIRADGSPRYSMVCIMSGAVLNCILNPIFMIGFNMGISGAAVATVVSQFVSVVMIFYYLAKKFKTFKITKEVLRPKKIIVKTTLASGVAPAVNQFSMTITQIVMNNSLTYYGALSVYGPDIPLAVAGIITKVNMIYMTIMIGLAQGAQPIIGYNYGSGRTDKVRECYIKCIKVGGVFSVMAFIIFQVFPENIISIFGSGSDEYVAFAVSYFRIFLMMIFLNGIQPITGNFFTAIGKPIKGAVISFTKQLMFLTPLILIIPLFLGIDGILYAGPIADTLAFVMSVSFVAYEFKKMKNESNAISNN